MTNVVGVRFKQVGKIYYFAPGVLNLHRGQHVIVETARGVEFGTVELGSREVEEDKLVLPLKKVLRVADASDLKQEEQNKTKEKDAFSICLNKIKDHGLDMKLIDVELTFDLTKIIFYFTSEGRVDFRELVRDLAAVFRMRIELRQIGVRDEAKILNGMGICGRALCCATFLGDFQPVSIKMAKEQNLSLNPTKISGICGRLMCCLQYEEETYDFLNLHMPNIGDVVVTPDGKGEVIGVQVLRQIVKASVVKKGTDGPSVGYYAAEEVKIVERTKVREEKGAIENYEKILDK